MRKRKQIESSKKLLGHLTSGVPVNLLETIKHTDLITSKKRDLAGQIAQAVSDEGLPSSLFSGGSTCYLIDGVNPGKWLASAGNYLTIGGFFFA